jgi:Gpi18-like mannosyltransferase
MDHTQKNLMKNITNKQGRRVLITTLVILGVLLALLLRYLLRLHTTNDYLCCLELWYDYIRQDGHYAFINAFSNLSMPILYAWYLITLIAPQLQTLIGTKIPAIICDIILAFYFYKIIAIKFSNPFIRLAAFLVPLFTPTVFLNSSWWGQYDSCYVAPIIAGLYYLMKKREFLAFLMFGLAFSVKFQMVFILPFLLILLLRRQLNWKSVLLIPGVYLVSILPAWLRGRPLLDLLMIYPQQAGQFHRLCMNAPTFYSWLSDDHFNLFYWLGIIITGILTLVFVYIAWKKSPAQELDPESLLHLALISTLILPTLLPMMQGRYYFQAEIIALALAFYRPRWFFLPIILQGLAMYTYGRYFFGYDTPGLGLRLGSFVLLSLLGYIVVAYLKKDDYHQAASR